MLDYEGKPFFKAWGLFLRQGTAERWLGLRKFYVSELALVGLFFTGTYPAVFLPG